MRLHLNKVDFLQNTMKKSFFG
uniref:Uncharacterized protein n=1 Tax=Anguilla anguilla TaxID=7936 RepID=A0A0E9TQ46_ANGAN